MKQYLLSIVVAVPLIAFAVAAAYYNSLNAEFVFDDFQNILTNPHIQIEDLSLNSLYDAAFQGPTNRPVSKLSFALNYYFGGLNTWGFHVINTLIHMINGVLVFLLARIVWDKLNRGSSVENSKDGLAQFMFAFAVALLFALHPIQTQAVTYTVQRMTSLCSMFYLSSLLAFLYGRMSTTRKQALIWWAVMLLAWCLAIGTKEIAVTLPFAILIFEWILFREGQATWMRRGLIYFAGFMLFAVALGFLFKGLDFFQLFSRGYVKRDFSMTERLLTEGRVVVHYISLIAAPLPSRLALVHDFPISDSLFNPISTIFCWLGILATITFAIVYAYRLPVICLSLLWFFLHLAVESTIIPLEITYEHRLYLPMFGVCILFCFGCFNLIRTPAVALTVFILVFAVLGFWTHQRNETWQTKLSLWEDNLTKYPDDPRVNYNVGIEHMKTDDNAQAMEFFERSVELEPNLQEVYLAIAAVFQRTGDLESAFAQYTKAVSIPKENIRGNYEYDEAYAERGKLSARKRDYANAVQDLDKAIEINPVNSKYYSIRAGANVFLAKPYKAIFDYQKAIQFSPSQVDAHSNFALFLATYPDESIAKPILAIKHAKIACELTEWKDYKTMSVLAAAHARAGNFTSAITIQNKSILFAPEPLKGAMQQRLQLFSNGTPILMQLPDDE